VAAWPRTAQLTTAFLLGAATTLLASQAWNALAPPARPTEREAAAVAAGRIDLNKARRADLLQLPGVGPAMVERIEAYRREHDGFRTVDELGEVRGIGPTTLARLRPFVSVATDDTEGPAAKPASPATLGSGLGSAGKKELALGTTIEVNRASQEELQKLPGIGPKMSQRIMDERAKKPFKSVDDLRRVSGIGAKTLEKLRPFVRVEAEPAVVATAE